MMKDKMAYYNRYFDTDSGRHSHKGIDADRFREFKHRVRPVISVFAALFMLFATSMDMSAQSRGAELKLPHLTPKEKAFKDDSLQLMERPYFLLIDQSEQALDSGDYAAAGLRLVEAMAVEPDNPLNVALMSNLGMLYFYNEQDSLALVTLNDVCRRSPRLIAGRENRARVLLAMGRDADAYEDYAAVIAIDSINSTARFYHGMIALYAGRLDTAICDFKVLERVVPESSDTYLAMGTLYSMTGNDKEAVSYLRKLVDRTPAPEYYAMLAGSLIVTESLNEASETLEKALKQFPNDGELYYYRAKLNRCRYMNDEAHQDAAKALKLGVQRKKVEALFQ